MNKEDFERVLNNLKMRFDDMDFPSYVLFLKRVERDIYRSLRVNNPMNLDPESFTNGRIINYLIEDKEFSHKIGEKIKQECKPDAWRYFRELLDGNLEVDTLMNIFRDTNLISLAEDKNQAYKLFGSIAELDSDKLLNFALENDNFFAILKDVSISQKLKLYSFSYDIYKKLIEKDIEFATRVLRPSEENYRDLIQDETLPNSILITVLDKCNSKEILNDFFENDPRREEIFNSMSNSEIVDLIDKDVTLDIKLAESTRIIDALATNSIVDFRVRLNRYEEYNPSCDIESKVEKQYDKLLASFNPETGMFKDYEEILKGIEEKGYIDIHSFDGIFKLLADENLYMCRTKEDFINLTNKKLKEIITDYLFKDNRYNVELNIKELERYEKENTIGNNATANALKAVNRVINEKKGIDLINALNVFKELGVGELYYDAIRGTKNVVNNEILNAVSTNEIGINKQLSSIYGVPIIDLREQKHYTLVRALSTPYREFTINERDCYTLISEVNTTMIHDDGYIYGYDDFDPDYILHVFEGDAFSTKGDKDTTKYVNRLMTPEEIVTEDSSISEIQIKNEPNEDGHGYKTIKPTCVIARDVITEKEINESKRLGIPIKLIKTQNLVESKPHTFFDDERTYVTSSFDERRRAR